MNKIYLAISFFVCLLPAAHADDFYSTNARLFNANHLNLVRTHALARLRTNPNSIQAVYFMAIVTVRQAGDKNLNALYGPNRYVDRFRDLYRHRAMALHMMHGQQIMVSDTRFVRLFYYLGLKFAFQKDYRRSAEWLNLAKIAYSDTYMFNSVSGTSNYAIKNYNKARSYYHAALKIAPNDGDTLYNLACLDSVQNRPRKALGWLKKAFAINAKYRTMAAKDSDLDHIRRTAGYRKLMEQ